ncbi:phosphoesterase family-domain-containing protein [Cantharellus anzutake]|uniref:phosphoesterase family-domain-containing protein n=1 Tax=Cantharellus anzutake TaxID=1750568 RepID=UPI00190558F4|nr:phosphoesterase family-domain-containing protein [Cantharellus anzutake]KAF8342583.1 phosphoesterase family-domain-containing protein [Cantharellus anzutake]
MPTDAYLLNHASKNYNTGSGSYGYYVRKHNPLIIHDAISNKTSRARRIRNFNDFAADVSAGALPQWVLITPNMVNDGHDTTIDFAGEWLKYWLVPLLKNKNFNSGHGADGTLIVLTFDENHSYTVQNRIVTILLGSAVPMHLKGTVDDTFYTHYSLLSTVEANWQLGNLGRGDTNLSLANVFDFVAKQANVKNVPPPNPVPLTNLTGMCPGPFNPSAWIPFVAPVKSNRFGHTYIRPGMNLSVTKETIGPPINITYADNPYAGTGSIVTLY